MPSILFFCIYNACRSRIAEAIGQKLLEDWIVDSAGISPSLQVDFKAAAILQKNGLAMTSSRPKAFTQCSLRDWDIVVSLVNSNECPSGLAAHRFVAWDIKDPFDGPMETYQSLYEDLFKRIQKLAGDISR